MNQEKNNKIKGILFILLAALGFSLMAFFVRISGDLPTMQKAFFRNIVALFIASGALIKNKTEFNIPKRNYIDIFLRSFCGTVGLVTNFYAIDRLGIADANMLNKLSPFFAIIMSIFILKEIPSRFDIACTITAFIGAIFIIRPTGANTQIFPALMGLLGGLGAGMGYTFVRKLGKSGVKAPIIVFAFSLFSSVVTLPFFLINYVPMTPLQWVYLFLAGAFASLGQFSITTAYKYAPAKEISVFDYTQVIFAALLGFIFFSEVPVLLSIIGYVIIIGVAVIRWRHNLGKE